MSTADKVGNREKYVKLAQLFTAIRRMERRKFTECLIKNQADVDYKVPATDFLKTHRPELIGSSALHFSLDQDNPTAFNLLLDHRADSNALNSKNISVVRRAVVENFSKRETMKLRRRFNDYDRDFSVDEVNGFVAMQRVVETNDFEKYDNWRLWGAYEEKYARSILAARVESESFAESPADRELSHLHAACLTNDAGAVDFFLKNRVDVDHPSSAFYGFAPLHFAVKYAKLEIVDALLANGANAFARDFESRSPLDLLVDQNLKIVEWLHAKKKLPYKNAIVDYVENEEKIKSITTKYASEGSSGLSRLHVACALADVTSIEKILQDDNSRINDSSSGLWSGYTALHLAAFFSTDAVKILLRHGADIEAKDANGVTPLEILSTRATIEDLHFVLSHKESWRSITLSDGRTKLLDVLSAMRDTNVLYILVHRIDVNCFVPLDSPLWPGYTILHLAVTFSETTRKVGFLRSIFEADRSNVYVEYENRCHSQEHEYLGRIEACLDRCADLSVKESRGWTPVHLAFRLRQFEAAALLLRSQSKTANPTDEDGLSHLHVACLARDHVLVEKLISNGADVNAAIKPSFRWSSDYHRNCTATEVFGIVGSTPLHLSVANEDLEMTRILLQNGADVNAKDDDGLSPLHRIFILQHVWEIGNDLFKVPKVVTYVLRRGRRQGIPSCARALETLDGIAGELMANLRESVVDEVGLSHLHVAVFKNDVQAVERLLDLGADVNLPIRCGKKFEASHPLFAMSRYEGCTPLHVARRRDNCNAQLEMLLVERGADVLARRADGGNSMFDVLRDRHSPNMDSFVKLLKDKEELRKRLEDEFGWTILHVACRLIDWESVGLAIDTGVNVNSRTREDSPFHPGSTALNILMASCYKIHESEDVAGDHERILRRLMDCGADVMLTDVQGNTPLHRCDFLPGGVRKSYARSTHAGQLLESIEDFATNPVNQDGISVFHIACIRHNSRVVQNFLDHGVDANRPVELFTDSYLAGCSPLHLVARHSVKSPDDDDLQLRTAELLLKSGADVRAEDVFGDTPLHAAAQCYPTRIALFQIILEYGAEIDAKNVYGKTPLETLLSSNQPGARELDFFLQRGCRMNTFNPITQVGYVPLLYKFNKKSMESETLQAALNCPSMREVDSMGRTALHNVVSIPSFPNNDDTDVIGHLVDESGCDIDRRDESGRTALHLAAQFRNGDAVEGLLKYEADVNVVDSSGKTAFAYSLEAESLCDSIDVGGHNHHRVVQVLARYIYHARLRGLRVNDVNARALASAFADFPINEDSVAEDYASLTDVRIGNTAFTLNDFLSETGAIVVYSKIEQKDRRVIEQFFTTTVGEHRFHDWTFLCKLQYRKALRRAELVDSAKEAMDVVVGFPLPDLCYEVIEKFLSNADLKRLIAATAF